MSRNLHRCSTHTISNHIGESKDSLHKWWKLIPYLHIFPVTRLRTSYLLSQTIFVHLGLLLKGPRMGHVDMIIFPFSISRLPLRCLALISDQKVISLRDQLISLIPIFKFLVFKGSFPSKF